MDRVLLRSQITAAIDTYFERPVVVEERLLQTLEQTDDPRRETVTSSTSLLAAGLAAQPGLAAALSDAGVRLDRLELDLQYPLNPNWDDYQLASQFDVWFSRQNEHGPATPTAAHVAVRQSGHLGLLDAVASCVEATYLDDFDRGRSPSANDVVTAICKAADSQRRVPERWASDRLDRFCSQVVESLDLLPLVDRSAGSQQFLVELDARGQLVVRPFGTFRASRLQEAPLRDGSPWIARGNVLQPASRFSEASLDEFANLINKNAPEADLQRFFENNPEYLLAMGPYEKAHAQLILRLDDGQSLVPDFFLEKVDRRFADLLDLKRPGARIVRAQRHRRRLTDALRESVAQLRTYRAWFDDRTNREEFRRLYGLDSFLPQAVVVIGRSVDFSDDTDRMLLEEDLPRWIRLETYDDVFLRARQWRRLVTSTFTK